MTPQEHSRLLGIFFLIQAGLNVFGGLLAGAIYGGMGAMFMSQARRSGDQAMGGFFIVMAFVVVAVVFAFAALNFFAGWKLFKKQQNARIWGIVASCVALLGFPLGTALGIYGLWFFFGEPAKRFYNNGNMAGSDTPPPPPQSWQQH